MAHAKAQPGAKSGHGRAVAERLLFFLPFPPLYCADAPGGRCAQIPAGTLDLAIQRERQPVVSGWPSIVGGRVGRLLSCRSVVKSS